MSLSREDIKTIIQQGPGHPAVFSTCSECSRWIRMATIDAKCIHCHDDVTESTCSVQVFNQSNLESLPDTFVPRSRVQLQTPPQW